MQSPFLGLLSVYVLYIIDQSVVSINSYDMRDPQPIFSEIITGHYVRDREYTNDRPTGCDSWLLIYTIAGRGRFGTRALPAVAGDLALLPPFIAHRYVTDPVERHWEMIWSHFYPRPFWDELLNWPEPIHGLRMLSIADESRRRLILDTLLNMHELAIGHGAHRTGMAMNALEKTLYLCDIDNPRTPQSRLDDRIQLAVNYICQNLAKLVTLPMVAAVTKQSGSRLSHLFKQQIGYTPLEYIERQRMETAKRLLSTTHLSIKEISGQVGFSDQLYFARRFCLYSGISARTYRRSHLPLEPLQSVS